ncbi:MAG: hypothetical protein O7C75_05210, partial [Verrucomicrobia bacterium]|nr:hypothetical protein [Verrucomicrobiota bacterium]
GPDDQHWLIVTAKGTHRLLVHDAHNGALIKTIGGLGDRLGQFNRPNGIWVQDDFLFVVERDNQRVQVMHLPAFNPLGSYGEGHLKNPYGLTVIDSDEPGEFIVYVTDNYETLEEEKPPLSELNQRVHRFEVEAEGITEGTGILNIVESIYADPVYDRLLIADEEISEEGQCIKVYNLAGQFTGQVLGKGIFQNQPEGISLWSTGPNTGFWILTDQGMQKNYFHVFNREDLEYVGTFEGEVTLNTDGVWLDATPSQRYPRGLFYAIHNDGNVAVFSLAEIATALVLERDRNSEKE